MSKRAAGPNEGENEKCEKKWRNGKQPNGRGEI
jgi:hypothetical protein